MNTLVLLKDGPLKYNFEFNVENISPDVLKGSDFRRRVIYMMQ